MKPTALIAALALTITTLTKIAATPASAGTCSIYQARTASWGCGRSLNESRIGGQVDLQDLRTDGRCIRISVRNQLGQWHDQGISHCSATPARYSYSSNHGDVTGVRMKSGWTNWYRTLRY
ncbi:MAG: hypothetical protein AAGA65_09070 [Actinomycetota bacterium]